MFPMQLRMVKFRNLVVIIAANGKRIYKPMLFGIPLNGAAGKMVIDSVPMFRFVKTGILWFELVLIPRHSRSTGSSPRPFAFFPRRIPAGIAFPI